ncbi:MAG: hypothetical protein Q4E12_03690 [Coriobacteriia bacterium]|nr:hypothetical protein [Coriobacteriia bacterium]
MTQRSQLNDRYNDNIEHKGVTRKGAGSLKPKSKAAASVYIEPTEKTPKQKKAERKERERAEREKQAKLDSVYQGKLTSDRMKTLRRYWWVCLVLAIIMTAISWLGRGALPDWATMVCLVLAYVFIIAALYIDLSKIRKERKRLQAAAVADKSKANKEERRRQKAEEKAALAAAEEKAAAEEAARAERRANGGLFGFSKKKAVEAADEVVAKQQAAAEQAAEQAEADDEKGPRKKTVKVSRIQKPAEDAADKPE